MAVAEFYVQLIPRRYGTSYIGSFLNLGPVTKTKPKRPVKDAHIVKLRVEIPDEVFNSDIQATKVVVPQHNVGMPAFASSLALVGDEDG